MAQHSAPQQAQETPATACRTRPGLARLVPMALVLCAGAVALIVGREWLGFHVIVENREDLVAWRDANLVAAMICFLAVYVAVVVFSVPGAIWVSIGGGFLFGTWAGTALNVAGATIGATLLFLVARSSLGAWLRARAAGWAARAAEGIERDQVSYLLALRLAPAMPFFVANLIPAFFRVRLWTFVWTTFLGIIPAAIVYTSFGAGIGEVIDRGETPDLSTLADPAVVLPLLGLMLVSLLPILVRRLRARRG